MNIEIGQEFTSLNYCAIARIVKADDSNVSYDLLDMNKAYIGNFYEPFEKFAEKFLVKPASKSRQDHETQLTLQQDIEDPYSEPHEITGEDL